MLPAILPDLSLFCLVVVALAIKLIFPGISPWLLFVAAIAGMAPLVGDVAVTLRKRRVDLGLPVIVTIVILLVLHEAWPAAVFVLLILSGRLFKSYVLWRVRRSVSEISKALPSTAIRQTGQEFAEIGVSEIRQGDILLVKAGGRVPVDGRLLSEGASLDESVVTGEARPAKRKAGDHLTAASINLGDSIRLEATDVSSNSTLAQMQRLVEEAQARNALISRFTTRYAEGTSLFALAVVALVYWLTRDLQQALALWIAFVPVIFAIIVPVATTTGISLLARSGALVKSPEALENLTRVDTLCFDKTGTLTQGQPSIVAIAPEAGRAEDEVLRAAASIERYSEHSLGRPIIEEATRRKLRLDEVSGVQVSKGLGISGSMNGARIAVGNRDFLQRQGASLPEAVLRDIERHETDGATPILVARERELIGIIYLQDSPRPDTAPTLARLRALGYPSVMLTGDQPQVAHKIGREIGISRVEAALLPQGKIDFIRSLKKQGHRVLMMGDGLNDAPALSEANVGVAMGLKGIEITLEAAQVVLVHDQIGVLPEIFSVAKRTFRIVRQDLVLATGIHLLAAVLVLFHVIGILGSTFVHQLSSASVLLNTLRLLPRSGPKA